MNRCHRRRLARLLLLASLLLPILACPSAAGAADGDGDVETLRHWGFGWDPGESGRGLTVRHRLSTRWDLAVAAGPDDYRMDIESQRWVNGNDMLEGGYPESDDNRREQGWVRLAAGGNFWRDGRMAVSGIGAVTYRWSVEEYSYRDYRTYASGQSDYWTSRDRRDMRMWSFALGIRPSFEITSRAQVEFEAGLEFERATTDVDRREWWDNHAETNLYRETRHQRAFASYGGFDFYRLKFIFWF